MHRVRAVLNAAEAVGPHGKGRSNVGLYDLRHSYVAMIIHAGASLPEAAMLARHANANVTAQICAGLTDRAKAEVAAKLVKAVVGA